MHQSSGSDSDEAEPGRPRGGGDDKTEIAAVRLLARREHATRELARKLESKGHAREAVERVVHKLSDKKLVCDSRFAASFVAHQSRRGQGPIRIRAELRERGASAEVIDEALSAADVDWIALAREVRIRKFGGGVPRTAAVRAKQARFLQYRGFTSDHIRVALASGDDSSVEGLVELDPGEESFDESC